MQRCAVVSLRRGSHRRIRVRCEFRVTDRCRHEWDIEERLANETRSKNDGKIICRYCSIATKRAGRTNPNARYKELPDTFFSSVDTEAKAYLLGWIASDGAIRKNTIALYVHPQDTRVIEELRDSFCASLPLRPKGNGRLIGFSINSVEIVTDVCRLLDIRPGKKDAVVAFPELPAELQWAFLRGFFDGDGSIASLAAAQQRAGRGSGWPAPRCSIATTSTRMLDAIAKISGIPAYRGKQSIEWNGTNALDFLGKLYDRATIYMTRKRDLYLDWCVWTPAIRSDTPPHPLFKWARVRADAVAPSKSSTSDSGFDLTLIDRAHRVGPVEFFRTGIKVQPAFGWYFDLVPRSSISKSGYMLANSIGVIDRGYTGEILVPLYKSDPHGPELPLPARIVQIIPRPIIAAQLVEVESFEETARGTGGFGSTG